MANYIEEREKRTPLAKFGGKIDIFQRQDGRISAVTSDGKYLGVDKRLQAKAVEISKLDGEAKAEAARELTKNIDMAYLCQCDENGNPAQIVTSAGEVRTAEFGWCMVLHTTPGNVLVTVGA